MSLVKLLNIKEIAFYFPVFKTAGINHSPIPPRWAKRFSSLVVYSTAIWIRQVRRVAVSADF